MATATPVRTKTVTLSEEEFKQPTFAYQFKHILRSIQNVKDVALPSNADVFLLSNLSYQIQWFLECNFGKSSPRPRAITKLPISVFNNFEENGPLFIILRDFLKFLYSKQPNCEIINLQVINAAEIIELIKNIERQLIDLGFIRYPKVYLANVPQGSITAYKSIITSHGGAVVEAPDSATHIVNWNEEIDTLPQLLTEEYVRPLEVIKSTEDGMVRVHWLYHPDSYEEIIPKAEVDVDVSETISSLYGSGSPTEKVWNVCLRFITDCEIFNEWGNELDYEIDDQQLEDDSAFKKGNKRKARKSAKGSISNIPLRDDRVTSSDNIMVDILPASRRQTRNTVTDLTSDIPKTFEETNPIQSTRSTRKRKIVSNVEESSILSPIDPFSVDSFTPTTISTFERDHLSFLHPSQCDVNLEENYIRSRTFIIELYNSSPLNYLSFTDCRQKLGGSNVNFLYEIYSLLDSFGIINNACPSDTKSKHFKSSLLTIMPVSCSNGAITHNAERAILVQFIQNIIHTGILSDDSIEPIKVPVEVQSAIISLGLLSTRKIALQALKESKVKLSIRKLVNPTFHFSNL